MEAGAPLILLASGRSDGNTAHLIERLRARLDRSTLVDVSRLRIEPFDYALSHGDDDFAGVVETMLASPTLVFASPVYWYAMSGPMKTLFDRLTDLLLTPEGRTSGRALAGRRVWVLATGTDPDLPSCFVDPFRLTADYFDMSWCGAFYVRCDKDQLPSEDALTLVDALAATMR